jgi:hypothetical protein
MPLIELAINEKCGVPESEIDVLHTLVVRHCSSVDAEARS